MTPRVGLCAVWCCWWSLQSLWCVTLTVWCIYRRQRCRSGGGGEQESDGEVRLYVSDKERAASLFVAILGPMAQRLPVEVRRISPSFRRKSLKFNPNVQTVNAPNQIILLGRYFRAILTRPGYVKARLIPNFSR